VKGQYERVIEGMKEDMRRIKEEWEHRLSEENLES